MCVLAPVLCCSCASLNFLFLLFWSVVGGPGLQLWPQKASVVCWTLRELVALLCEFHRLSVAATGLPDPLPGTVSASPWGYAGLELIRVGWVWGLLQQCSGTTEDVLRPNPCWCLELRVWCSEHMGCCTTDLPWPVPGPHHLLGAHLRDPVPAPMLRDQGGTLAVPWQSRGGCVY